MSAHIPAWKRLGLKLKYAKDLPDSTGTGIIKNVHGNDHLVSERPVKRRRIVKNDKVTPPEQNSFHSSSDNPARLRGSKETSTTNGSPQQAETSKGSLTESIQRRKSVTFSEETKQEDGDSRTTIDFPAGCPGSTPKRTKRPSKAEPLESPTNTTITNDNIDSNSTNHDTTPTKKQSKPKSGKKTKQSKASTKDKSSSALDYLTSHRSARDSWKFNKILDVWILNHALDVQAIPSTYVPSLAGYVRGLPARAGSRDRLVKECREALSSSQLDEDVNEEDRSLFVHFVESQDGPLGDATRLEEFLKAHSRAAVLLWSLDETVGGGSPMNSAARQGNLPVKKKKSRTSAPIDISSSSESDSDSDSSDDSSESEDETKWKTNGKSMVAVNGSAEDDTSSSGTSSSGDEDEDETFSSEESSDPSSDEDDE